MADDDTQTTESSSEGAPAKKTAKRPARKTAKKTAKKTASRSASRPNRSRDDHEGHEHRERDDDHDDRGGRSRSSSRSSSGRPSAVQVARRAAQQLTELTGRQSETVIGISRTDDGWSVEVEAVESHRIPDSTDVLATYEVDVDEQGELTGYRRARRYIRGKSGDGSDGSR